MLPGTLGPACMVESVDDEGDDEGESQGVRCLCRDNLTRASSEIQIGQPAQPGESLYDLDTCLEYSSIKCHEDSGPFLQALQKNRYNWYLAQSLSKNPAPWQRQSPKIPESKCYHAGQTTRRVGDRILARHFLPSIERITDNAHCPLLPCLNPSRNSSNCYGCTSFIYRQSQTS